MKTRAVLYFLGGLAMNISVVVFYFYLTEENFDSAAQKREVDAVAAENFDELEADFAELENDSLMVSDTVNMNDTLQADALLVTDSASME